MNLWLVGNIYVIADGPAGACYLADAFNGELVKLIARNIVDYFKPRVITFEEASKLLSKK